MASNSKLEKEFSALFKKCSPQIKEKLKIASSAIENPEKGPAAVEALKEAIAIADENGIPFHSDVVIAGTSYIMALANSYVPQSFTTKFGTLNMNMVSKLTGVNIDSLSGRYRSNPWNDREEALKDPDDDFDDDDIGDGDIWDDDY